MASWHQIFAVILGIISQTVGYSEDELRYDLFATYDKLSRPSKTTAVDFRVTIKHFEMDERSHSLMVDAWMLNEWEDPRLKWDPEDYGAIPKITVPHDMLWKPDIAVYNSANVGENLAYGNIQALLFAHGRIVFVPPAKLHFTCVMDLTRWPHDTHNCTCIIGSWMHDGHAIDLRLPDDKPELDLPVRFTEDGRNISRGSWNLVDSSIVREVKNYSCCDEPYITIHMSMLVTRNAPAYEWTVKGPAIGLSILTLVVFLLPPAAGEKVIFGILCLLLDMVYIAFASSTISLAPSHLPLIVEMICKQATLVIASIVISALSLRVARDPHTSGLPSFVKTPLLALSPCFCLESYKNLASRVHHHPYSPHPLKTDEYDVKENGNGHVYVPEVSTCPGFDWLLLSAFLDRVCLVIYVIIFVVNMYKFSAIL
ncbi:neuronal acetylcholine receptor subunit alpha-6-like [Macrobrachium rosenbergii]|uniref:neuronal acetylcholine receptor subunit alpha-6-like n=1 Tax=Macrobrachium rosenbergii TaxID=79674 RepID=UPI0034D751E5